MRNLAGVLIPLFLVSASTVPDAQERDSVTNTQSSNIDDQLFDWCMSQVPNEEGENATPLPRPAGKLRPFELAGAVTPPNLVTQTEIIGTLPPEIEKYKGQWTWPSHDREPSGAIFVERLTPTEMVIAWAFKPDKGQDASEYRNLRYLLKWTGNRFSSSKSSPDGTQTMDIAVSADGEAMLMVSGLTRTITLEDSTGKKESFPSGEAWPACFIAEKRRQG